MLVCVFACRLIGLFGFQELNNTCHASEVWLGPSCSYVHMLVVKDKRELTLMFVLHKRGSTTSCHPPLLPRVCVGPCTGAQL